MGNNLVTTEYDDILDEAWKEMEESQEVDKSVYSGPDLDIHNLDHEDTNSYAFWCNAGYLLAKDLETRVNGVKSVIDAVFKQKWKEKNRFLGLFEDIVMGVENLIDLYSVKNDGRAGIKDFISVDQLL